MGFFPVILLSLLAFLLLWYTVHAEIKYTSIDEDSRTVIEFEKFSFTNKGYLDITITNVSWSAPFGGQGIQSYFMGFFLITEENRIQVSMEHALFGSSKAPCILQNDVFQPLFTFRQLDRTSKSFNRSFSAPNANEYVLIFVNCLPSVRLSMKVRTAMYNLQENGRKDYLSVGQTQLPKLYFAFFLLYLVLFGEWLYVCFKKKDTVHMIHILMGLLVILKAFDVLCEAEDKAYTKRTGTAHGWDIAFYAFSFVKGVMLFTVIVLIGTGWSILKPFLQEKEKRVLMMVIPLQVFANIAAVVIDETGPSRNDWVTWTQLFLVVDVICCCAVLFPIIWSIKHLQEAARTNGKAARSLVKLTLFRQYYIVVVGYIYFTRIVVFALKTVMPYRYLWTSDLTTEMPTLAFYIFTGYKFRPEVHNPYSRPDEDEEEAAVEEFEL